MKQIIKDKFNNKIPITNERWSHIIKEHPEVEAYRHRVPDVLSKPDIVKESKKNKDIFLYYRYYTDIYHGKYLLLVARTKNNPLLVTGYITDRIKEGELIWKKN